MNNQKEGGRENYELRTYLDDKNNASFSVFLVTLKRIFSVAFFVIVCIVFQIHFVSL